MGSTLRPYNALQLALGEEYGSLVTDANAEVLEQFVMLAADEGLYGTVVGHAIMKGLDNWKAKKIEDLYDDHDRKYVKALLENAALDIAEEQGISNGKITPPKELAMKFIYAIDALVEKEKLEHNKGGSRGL